MALSRTRGSADLHVSVVPCDGAADIEEKSRLVAPALAAFLRGGVVVGGGGKSRSSSAAAILLDERGRRVRSNRGDSGARSLL
jgi:hypothetical protein